MTTLQARQNFEMSSLHPPEQGQTVFVRHRIWEVSGVAKSGPRQSPVHRVSLRCLSDDALGAERELIWEREVDPIVLERASLPSLSRVDSPEMFQAFLTAMRWSGISLAQNAALDAPFRSGVQIESYQLAPLLRARSMPRVRLLIADDVGLGKTIETGLIVQDLVHSSRATSALVVCPAHLKEKWVEEMADKFGLEFRIIDGDSVLAMRKEFGPSINPWASFPRLVTSIDYLKTEHPRRLFLEIARRRAEESGSRRPWDLLILDEAHNAAPAGRQTYVRDSERTRLLREISPLFEHRIFVTATPHNGYRESFTGLLELLDELRFSRGTEIDKAQWSAVRVRRLKSDINAECHAEGRKPLFPTRVIVPRTEALDPDFYVDLSREEGELFDLLDRYRESRLEKATRRNERATRFSLGLLKKRALSSPLAFRETLLVHSQTVGVAEELDLGPSLFQSLADREDEDWSDDEEREEILEEANAAASRLLDPLDGSEKAWLKRMATIVEPFAIPTRLTADSKARALLRWIERALRPDGQWSDERVIIFTEYRHTQEYLVRLLEELGYRDAILQIYGGMSAEERTKANAIFQEHPQHHPARILIATDAASEGADFQRYCRNLIHYEIPWNPARLEQRNGRIDRYGQRATEVHIHHFVYAGRQDAEFRKRLVEKIDAMRTDLGSVSKLIAESIERSEMGEAVDLDAIERSERRQLAFEDTAADAMETDRLQKALEAMEAAQRELGLTESAQREVLERALALEGHPDALSNIEEAVFTLGSIPPRWHECRRLVTTSQQARRLTFERRLALERDNLEVIHLNHPLMQRAISSFRAEMWSSPDLKEPRLRRATIEVSDVIERPTVVGWGRIVLLGSDGLRLHEGLIRVGLELDSGSFRTLEPEKVEHALKLPTRQGESSQAGALGDADKLRGAVESELNRAADKIAEHLASLIAERGRTAAEQAKALCDERIASIRKALRQWERDRSSDQFRFKFEDEQEQKDTDMRALEAQLEVLARERREEPDRLRRRFQVARDGVRVYPIALQAILPSQRH